MDYPPDGMEVCVTLVDTTVMLAYWKDGNWWQGIANDPNDRIVTADVLGWDWRTE